MAAIDLLQRWAVPAPVRAVANRLPLGGRLLIALAVFAACAVGVGTMLAANQVLSTTSTHPFAPYEHVMPDQPLEAKPYPCNFTGTESYNPRRTTVFYCEIHPEDGPFRRIAIGGSNRTIRSVMFRVDDLRVGDLIEKWGPPDRVNKYQQAFSMRWNDGIFATGTFVGRFNHWSMVDLVLLTTRYKT